MNKVKVNIKLLALATLFCTLAPVQSKAQVTIGSNVDTRKGSLLDLKEYSPKSDNTTATRGLALPRVDLTDKHNLYPMLESSPGSGTPTTGYAGSNKDTQDAAHTGLVVYNLNKCDGFGRGIYVWEGKEWQPLGDVKFLQQPDISITHPESQWINKNTLLIHLPSGRDLRTFPSDNKFNLGFSWQNTADGAMAITNVTETMDGGLKFINSSHPGSWTNPINSSPVSFDYYIDDMYDIIPSDNANVDNPFRSRETSVTFETPANECDDKEQLTVRLNQTNYRLTVKRDNAYFNNHSFRFRSQSERFSSGVNYYRFLLLTPYSGSNAAGFKEESNARWYASYEEITTGILEPNIVSNVIPGTGGEERFNGTTVENTRNPAYISASTDQNKYKTAGVLTYTDTAFVNRFYPVEIHFLQCAVEGYEQSNIKNAADYTEDQWGDKILRHTDRNNNTFYSAVFGNAGRWMTSNLAATTYDEGSGREGEDVEVYQTIDLQEHDNGRRKYAYPILDSGGEPADWGARPSGWRQEEGIFYNWYAATGRTFDDNGTVQEGASAAESTIVQGICPSGWYLPSDAEWNKLEEEIYSNIGKYATYDAVDLSLWTTYIQTNPWNPAWNTTRGNRSTPIENHHIGHGAAMKDICPPKSSGTQYTYMQGSKGYSKEYNEGGFNATLVGRIKAAKDNGTTDERLMKQYSRAYNVDYWTRSQNSNRDAWLRDFNVNNGWVDRTTYVKTHLLSVRCKKR